MDENYMIKIKQLLIGKQKKLKFIDNNLKFKILILKRLLYKM